MKGGKNVSAKDSRHPDRPQRHDRAGHDRAGPDRAGGHAFDRWLTRELAALHAQEASRPLPDEMTDLAARLEARLKAARSGQDGPRSK